LVSWIALVISTLAVLISLYVVIRDRPRLGVLTRNDVVVKIGDEPIYTWHVTVINYGRHPQAISDVGLIGKDPGFSAYVSTLRQSGVQVIGPDLPVIVPPYNFLNWTVPGDAMRVRFPNSGQEFRSFVVKYSPVFRSVWLNRIVQVFRSHRRRVIGTVNEYQYGYRRMPDG
jgi:hypothetical protein